MKTRVVHFVDEISCDSEENDDRSNNSIVRLVRRYNIVGCNLDGNHG